MTSHLSWYLPSSQGLNYEGPYDFLEIVSKIETGQLHMDDFTWGPELPEKRWYRFYELEIFSPYLKALPKSIVPQALSRGMSRQIEQVCLNFEKLGEYGVENQYRRFPRAPFHAEAIIHNQKIYCHAECIDISEKGLQVNVPAKVPFLSGEEVMITVFRAPYLGTFSVLSVIIKIFNENSLEKSGLGIYFLKLNPKEKRKIAHYIIHVLQGKNPEHSEHTADLGGKEAA